MKKVALILFFAVVFVGLAYKANAFIVCYLCNPQTERGELHDFICWTGGGSITCTARCDHVTFDICCYEDSGFGGMCNDDFPVEMWINCVITDQSCLIACISPLQIVVFELCKDSPECTLCN